MFTKIILLIALIISLNANAVIKVEGSETFTSKVKKTLDFLKQKAPSHYKFVDQHIDLIAENSRSGAGLGRKTIDLNLVSCPNVWWCSAVFVHETYHFYQASVGIYSKQTSRKNEYQANKYMLSYLKMVGASQSYIRHLTKLVEDRVDHSDLNGDGVYDSRDYNLRRYKKNLKHSQLSF